MFKYSTCMADCVLLLLLLFLELYQFLDEHLKCFSNGNGRYFHNGPMEFKPPGGEWQTLAYTLRKILEEKQHRMGFHVPFDHITYLRQGFNGKSRFLLMF